MDVIEFLVRRKDTNTTSRKLIWNSHLTDEIALKSNGRCVDSWAEQHDYWLVRRLKIENKVPQNAQWLESRLATSARAHGLDSIP